MNGEKKRFVKKEKKILRVDYSQKLCNIDEDFNIRLFGCWTR